MSRKPSVGHLTDEYVEREIGTTRKHILKISKKGLKLMCFNEERRLKVFNTHIENKRGISVYKWMGEQGPRGTVKGGMVIATMDRKLR